MTAEIAIMNRSAIALATDSAVTISGKNNFKIYNTVNKLFTLSKGHPIGIMIYGSAELMGIPWETILKTYRNKLAEENLPTLEEYAKNFVDFLDNKNPLNDYSVSSAKTISTEICALKIAQKSNKKLRNYRPRQMMCRLHSVFGQLHRHLES